MNGMILQTALENKDIKFSKNLVKNTQEQDDENLFASLIEKLVSKEDEGSSSSFLLSKLLDLESSLPQMGKKVSFFSGGELIEQLSDKGEGESEGEFALLEELFKVALMVKDGEDLSSFSTNSKELKLALNDKNVIAELKDAKNINDLLKIAKKSGIEVKNFQFFSEKLALDPKDKKLVSKLTSSDIFKMVDQSKTKDINPSNKTDILSSVISDKISTKDVKAPKSILHELLNKNHTKKPQQTVSTKDSVVSKSISLSENEGQIETEINPLNEKIKDTKPKKSSLSKDELKSNDNAIDIDALEINRKKDAKVSTNTKDGENISIDDGFEAVQNQKSRKNTLSTLLKNSDPKETVANKNSIDPKELLQKSDSTNAKEDKALDTIKSDEVTNEDKSTTTTVKSDISVKTKDTPEVKRSLNTFATEFKEKVESYKPPLMKVKMQLNPQNLGEVDVTLINRGNSLHVNITSNHNSMALFMQNQAEFKNSLVNMGFTDLSMNFSQNGESKGQQQDKKQDQNQADFENFEEENNPSVDVILPNYV